mgnify:CR=1 FL=1
MSLAKSIVLIDISADSVAGAYAHYKESEMPTLLYARRLPIELHDGEPHETSMLRTFSTLGNTLIREGAPTLARSTGSGSADAILVSVDAPWQETKVRTESFEQKSDFIFTKKMVATVFEKTSVAPLGNVLADESIIGTILNGYETREPYGKKVHRASVIILTSLIKQKVSDGIVTVAKSLFHTKNIFSIAGSSLRYQAVRRMFPHERDALILDAMRSLISVALVRKNLLVAVAEVSDAVVGGVDSASSPQDDLQIKKIMDEFAELAKQYPLPRTIFLLSQERGSSFLEEAFKTPKLGGLWLSDNPPKVVPLLASHITGFVRQITTEPPDLPLLLMALYWQHRP